MLITNEKIVCIAFIVNFFYETDRKPKKTTCTRTDGIIDAEQSPSE